VEALSEIGTALHAAIIKMDAGLMTIVADLSDLGYNALKPAQMDKVVQLLLPKYFSHVQNMRMSSTLTFDQDTMWHPTFLRSLTIQPTWHENHRL
jgi:hypothetical protein